jgi:hypothetical protein
MPIWGKKNDPSMARVLNPVVAVSTQNRRLLSETLADRTVAAIDPTCRGSLAEFWMR